MRRARKSSRRKAQRVDESESGSRRSTSRQILGRRGEEAAVRALRRSGYRILARNWRCGRYEIDIVGLRDAEVVFVEVKTRRPGPQAASEALTPAQRRNIVRAAACWIRSHPDIGRTFRFDVVAVTWCDGEHARLEHIPAAFTADGP